METTPRTLSDSLLREVSERIERHTGLHFPPARYDDLGRGLIQAAREAGCREARAYVESLLNRDLYAADLEALAGSLTVGETHFFRDPRAFSFLETTLLPELIAARRGGDRRLRIWSAGCATGEEPYSIAILLHRLISDLADWRITILGTDINPKVLVRAAAGVYSEWSFRDTPEWVKPRYLLSRPGKHYEIQPWLKRLVTFACLNLADDVYPSVLNNTNAMDLIVCCNVLLYFAPARIPPVVERFHRALIDGGHLVLGAVEASQMTFPEFTPVQTPGLALYRKGGSAERKPRESELPTVGPRQAFSAFLNPPSALRASPSTIPAGSAVSNPPAAIPTASPVRKPPRAIRFAEANDLYEAGRYLDARALLLAGTDRPGDNDPQSAMLLARCHANLGELAEALVWCERAVATAKTDPALHFLRAGILQELQRDDEALQALRNVVFLDPRHVVAHFTMANLCRRRNRLSAAAKHLANARQLLADRDESEELPQSGGLTVGRLNAILAATVGPTEGKESVTHE